MSTHILYRLTLTTIVPFATKWISIWGILASASVLAGRGEGSALVGVGVDRQEHRYNPEIHLGGKQVPVRSVFWHLKPADQRSGIGHHLSSRRASLGIEAYLSANAR